MVAQAERRRNTRTALLDAARRVIAEQGVEGAGLEEIAARAGYTKGAIYGHFATKDDLVLAVLDALSDDLAVEVGGEGVALEQALEALFAFDTEAAQLFIELLVFALRHDRTRERISETLLGQFAVLAGRLDGPRAQEQAIAINGAVLGLIFLRLLMGPDIVNGQTISSALDGLIATEAFSQALNPRRATHARR